jgi:glycerate dehydrogenase
MKAVVLDAGTLGLSESAWKELGSLCDLTLHEHTLPAEINKRAIDADAILTNKVVLSEACLSELPRLKYIGVLATGFDNIAVGEVNKREICLSNVPEYSSAFVAQHVFSLLLSLTNQVTQHDATVKEGAWTLSKHFSYWLIDLTELANHTLGIVGYGRIAKKVSRIAKALDMDVIVYTPRPPAEKDIKFVEMDTLFKESDIISLHCPLNETTHQLINQSRLLQMKKSAILINTSRGGLVDENALSEALLNKQIQAACLDVLTHEPPKKDNPLINLDNCIITPHIAWAANASRNRLLKTATENFHSFLKGKPTNRVGL